MSEAIQRYWEERARNHVAAPEATTNDVHLRELEASTLVDTLSSLPARTVLDVGCGDGKTTIALAEALPHLRFLGLDYADSMVASARQELGARSHLEDRVSFAMGDATELGQSCGDALYDVVTTDRCLINLQSKDDQRRAVEQIAAHTRPDGHYVAIENFNDGQVAMNDARGAMGLPEIPVRWHNLYLDHDEFARITEPFFEHVELKEFSSAYYFATRVIYSAMCQMRGEAPDYHHEIHQLAVKLPWFGSFSPIKMVVMRRRAE